MLYICAKFRSLCNKIQGLVLPFWGGHSMHKRSDLPMNRTHIHWGDVLMSWLWSCFVHPEFFVVHRGRPGMDNKENGFGTAAYFAVCFFIFFQNVFRWMAESSFYVAVKEHSCNRTTLLHRLYF